MRATSSINYTPDSKNKGFNYEMIKSFTTLNNLKLELVSIPSFSRYWKLDETKRPDIYKDVDMAAEIFTVTKKREEMISMIPYIDNVELLFGKHNSNIKSYKDLIGKSLLTYEAMSFYNILKTEMDKQQIPYKVTMVKSIDGNMVLPQGYKVDDNKVNFYVFPTSTKVGSKVIYYYIAKGDADVGINDGIAVLIGLYDNNYYKENLRPLIPARTKRSQLAWGSSQDTPILNQKLKEFIKEDRVNGDFSNRLERYTGMSLNEYTKLLTLIK